MININLKKVILGIGSNLGDRLNYLNQSISHIGNFPKTRFIRASSIYETEPWGNINQGKYLNCCCEIETDLSPVELLNACLYLENQFGRVREEKWGARTLDIDLLIFEGEDIKQTNLIIPHPRIKERGFVLVPLFELYPNGNALGYEFLESLRKVGSSGIVKYA